MDAMHQFILDAVNSFGKISPSAAVRSMLCIVLFTIVLPGFSACAHYPLNLELSEERTTTETKSQLPEFPERSEELYLVVALSGGGTRAAALSYGVLEALSKIEVPISANASGALQGQAQRTLLEEIDVISSVSGGSFTAAYYCLYKDRLFEDYKDRFLYYNVSLGIIWRHLSPLHWFLASSPWYGRGDMAAVYYDKLLFDGATFGDLQFRNAPLLFIQATDMVDGNGFGFTPYQFDLICSDLSEFPLSRAVAASSAFPGAFDAIVLKNYAGSCELEEDPWLARALVESKRTSRIFRAAARTHAYLDPEKKPFIHLLDGGVADNLGIRGPLDFVVVRGGITEYLESMGQHKTRRVVFIIVNAAGKASSEWSLGGKLAGITRVLGISSTVMLSGYTYETMELLRSYTREWSAEREGSGFESQLDFYVIEVSFEALSNDDERQYFLQVPTTLALANSTVDELSAVGRRILYESEDFRRLVHDLGAEIPSYSDNSKPLSW